jgi:hypothetical protein
MIGQKIPFKVLCQILTSSDRLRLVFWSPWLWGHRGSTSQPPPGFAAYEPFFAIKVCCSGKKKGRRNKSSISTERLTVRQKNLIMLSVVLFISSSSSSSSKFNLLPLTLQPPTRVASLPKLLKLRQSQCHGTDRYRWRTPHQLGSNGVLSDVA